MTHDEIRAYLVKQNPGKSIKFIGSGSDSEAFCVDGYVYRFPHSATVLAQYKTESALCDFLRDKISVPIPQITIHDVAVCYAKHKMIAGKKWRWHTFIFHPIKQNNLADGIARFFAEIHGADIHEIETDTKQFNYVAFDDIAARIAPFLSKHAMRRFHKKYNNIVGKRVAESNIVMCHMGLKGANSVIDNDGNIVGVFDFGNTGAHERWRDFGVVYMGDNKRLYSRVLHKYEQITGMTCDRSRIADVAAIEHFSRKRWFCDDGSAIPLTDKRITKYLSEAMVRFYHMPLRFRRVLRIFMRIHKRLFN